MRTEPLPLEFPGVHYLDEREVEAAARVLRARSPFRFYGVDLQNEVEKFEAEFAGFVETKHALAVGKGTGALHTAMAVLGVGPGQEVIVTAYLWVSVMAAIVNLGACSEWMGTGPRCFRLATARFMAGSLIIACGTLV